MRYATILKDGGPVAGMVEGESFVSVGLPDVAAVMSHLEASGGKPPAQADDPLPMATARLLPPVVHPAKIICVGLNYDTHVSEMGRARSSYPALFAKFATALVGPYDDIVLPRESTQVDWEAELALVIGRRTRRARGRAAYDSIGGLTIMNDISVRDWQRHTSQFLPGKNFDNSTPVGPSVVTLDEFSDPFDLQIRCEVDGEVVQSARTSEALFDPVHLVEYISTICTLEPGDIIATGTPGGVGHAAQPPRFLAPGQTVTTAIEGLGVTRNTCVPEV